MRAQITLAAIVAVLTTSAAWAAEPKSEAVLAAPASRAMIVLDGRVWRCVGQTCVATGKGRSQSVARECARVARKLGVLVAYSRDGQAVDGEILKACNAGLAAG